MFYNLSQLKKLMKEAWKGIGGLKVEVTDKDVIALQGLYWSLEIDKTTLPNKAKAALIELIGEIPEAGSAYTFAQDIDPQTVIPGVIYKNLMQQYADSNAEYIMTNIAVKTNATWATVFQGGTKLMVPNKFADGIDNTKIEEGETSAENPRLTGEKMMIWCNNTMAAMCLVRPVQYIGEKEFLDSIKYTDLTWNWTEEERI